MEEIILFNDKKECCACGACVNICPKKAISLKPDECGFLYPEIDRELCVKCGACKKACAFQNKTEKNIPIKTFAAVSENKAQKNISSSGGIFSAIASEILESGGVVFGAAFGDDFSVSHIAVDSKKELYRLQGSKYVYSSTGDTFTEVKRLLKDGKKVLYSGVPCQIAGLYGYLGKDYDNLLTVDIVCHGVPSGKMFADFIASLEKENGKLEFFTFRDKSIGWGKNGRAVAKKDGKEKSIKLYCSANPYFYYFERAFIFRENCYSCKYACENRPADITLGDFWGIEKQHPDYIGKNGFDTKSGISLMVCNTEKGLSFIENASGIELKPSEFSKASASNPQLREPSKRGPRDELIKLYAEEGWEAVVKRYESKIGFRKHSSMIKSKIPTPVKSILKRFK